MLIACQEARNAGLSIKLLTEMRVIGTSFDTASSFSSDSSNNNSNNETLSMTHVANSLLNAIIKVLLLADVVIINQIISAKNKVNSLFFFLSRNKTKNKTLNYSKNFNFPGFTHFVQTRVAWHWLLAFRQAFHSIRQRYD